MPRLLNSRPTAPSGAESARASSDDFQFIFKRRHRNVPEVEIFADLKRVADLLNVTSLSMPRYRQHGKFGTLMIQRRFSGWNAALIKAGLTPGHLYRVPAKKVLADIRRVARKLKSNCLLGTQYDKHGQFSTSLIYRHFRTWDNAVKAAGLTPSKYRTYTTAELFDNLEQVWRKLGQQPKTSDMRPPLSCVSAAPYAHRFGGFQNALKAFIDYLPAKSRPSPCKPTAPLADDRPGIKQILHKTSRHIPWRLRYLILRRDHFKCQACGRSPATEPTIRLQIDHKTPWSRGGETIMENLQTLCERCNGGKSNL